jgi:hypothetical protein
MNSGEAILQVIDAADAAGIAYIESWCDRHNTRALLEELRAAVPPI